MESQLTLVDPSAYAPHDPKLDALIILQFEKDCVHNTAIIARGEEPPVRYNVQSDAQASSTHVTKVVGPNNPVSVGLVNRRSFLPDTISLGEFTIDLGKWLRTPALSMVPATFSIGERSFTWSQSNRSQLELKSSQTVANAPVAWVDRTPIRVVDGHNIRSPPTIYLHEEAKGVQDEVVLSFLVLEHRLRAVERAREAKSAASMFAGH